MNNMFSKTENLNFSPPVIGSDILKIFKHKKTNKLNIIDLMKTLNKSKKISPKSLYGALIFLYTIDLIEFNEPYIYLKK